MERLKNYSILAIGSTAALAENAAGFYFRRKLVNRVKRKREREREVVGAFIFVIFVSSLPLLRSRRSTA